MAAVQVSGVESRLPTLQVRGFPGRRQIGSLNELVLIDPINTIPNHFFLYDKIIPSGYGRKEDPHRYVFEMRTLGAGEEVQTRCNVSMVAVTGDMRSGHDGPIYQKWEDAEMMHESTANLNSPSFEDRQNCGRSLRSWC